MNLSGIITYIRKMIKRVPEYADVFTMGMPTYSYSPRKKQGLEDHLDAAIREANKLIIISGMTKLGKTVLAGKVLAKRQHLWFDGGTYTWQNDIWEKFAYDLGLVNSYSQNSSSTIRVGEGIAVGNTVGETKTASFNYRTIVLDEIKKRKIPIVIDDFHYIPRDDQGNIIRLLKPLVFYGVPTIIITIPHRRYDAVRVEKEMTGRVRNINIKPWTEEELYIIPDKGFKALKLNPSKDIYKRFTEEAFGSPHLMQQFCYTYCKKMNDEYNIDNIFKDVAEENGRIIFDSLRRGPKTRKDRKKRILFSGEQPDIYGLVLATLMEIKPGVQSYKYEDIRAAMRNIVIPDHMPSSQEISKVLIQMSKIASSDEASTPVIDWDKDNQILHITDPFFAFFLKWADNTL